MASGRFISYLRVSTAKQGVSGLGLEAQREAVVQHLNGGRWTLLAEYLEVESGKSSTRPQLAAAMQQCRLTGATLLVAKLDRLSRNAHFLIGLRDAGIDFVAADMPDANKLTVGIMALVAEQEREAISARTKSALAASKARGTVLGGYRGAPPPDGASGVAARQAGAQAFAGRLSATLTDMQARSLSLGQMAAELTAAGIRTPQDGTWTATAVRRVLARASHVSDNNRQETTRSK